ncbi:hypothetical protein B0H13DRAFT_2513715 [Mycena leptocephala]|nr:hypothetical protein B0H13DRAFT_2513715 [Mycena leptocephala]
MAGDLADQRSACSSTSSSCIRDAIVAFQANTARERTHSYLLLAPAQTISSVLNAPFQSHTSIRFARLSNRTGAPCLEFLAGRLKISIAAASPPGFVPDLFGFLTCLPVTPPPPGITLTPTRPFLELRPRYLTRDPLLKTLLVPGYYNDSNQGQVVSPEFRLVSFLYRQQLRSTLFFSLVLDGSGPPVEVAGQLKDIGRLSTKIFYVRTTSVVSIHRARLVFDTHPARTHRGRPPPLCIALLRLAFHVPQVPVAAPSNQRDVSAIDFICGFPPHPRAERRMKRGKRAERSRVLRIGMVTARTSRSPLEQPAQHPQARTAGSAVDEVDEVERRIGVGGAAAEDDEDGKTEKPPTNTFLLADSVRWRELNTRRLVFRGSACWIHLPPHHRLLAHLPHLPHPPSRDVALPFTPDRANADDNDDDDAELFPSLCLRLWVARAMWAPQASPAASASVTLPSVFSATKSSTEREHGWGAGAGAGVGANVKLLGRWEWEGEWERGIRTIRSWVEKQLKGGKYSTNAARAFTTPASESVCTKALSVIPSATACPPARTAASLVRRHPAASCPAPTRVLHDAPAVRILRGTGASWAQARCPRRVDEHRAEALLMDRGDVFGGPQPASRRMMPRNAGPSATKLETTFPSAARRSERAVMMLPGSKPSLDDGKRAFCTIGKADGDEHGLAEERIRSIAGSGLRRARVDLLGELEPIEFRLKIGLGAGLEQGFDRVHEAVTRKYVRERRQRVYEGLDASTSPRLGPYQEYPVLNRVEGAITRGVVDDEEAILGGDSDVPFVHLDDRDLVNRTPASSRLITALRIELPPKCVVSKSVSERRCRKCESEGA